MNRHHAVAIVAALILAGCAAPTRITSNKAATYAKQPARVFIMTDVGSEWGSEYYSAFKAKSAALLAQCGAAASVDRISELELDENVHFRRAAAFKADTLLSVRRNGGTRDQYGNIINVNYDSRLLDVESKKVVWRSSARFVRGLMPIKDRGEQLAIDITNKLKEDGIFPSCPVVKAAS